jgi:F420H(2)-dependent biliverdin reductase
VGYLAERLAHERIAWMCTLPPDGSPHVTPVWFVYRDGTWWIGSEERSVKVRNVSADHRVSLALDGGDAPVVAEGRARILRRDFAAEVVAAFAAKYDGWDVTFAYRGLARDRSGKVGRSWTMFTTAIQGASSS